MVRMRALQVRIRTPPHTMKLPVAYALVLFLRSRELRQETHCTYRLNTRLTLPTRRYHVRIGFNLAFLDMCHVLSQNLPDG